MVRCERGETVGEDYPPRKARSPLNEAGFLLRVFPRERQYAELGYLLPFFLRLAVKTRCIGPSSWHALYLYPITVWTFGHAPVGHGTNPATLARCCHVLAELDRRDVLGTAVTAQADADMASQATRTSPS